MVVVASSGERGRRIDLQPDDVDGRSRRGQPAPPGSSMVLAAALMTTGSGSASASRRCCSSSSCSRSMPIVRGDRPGGAAGRGQQVGVGVAVRAAQGGRDRGPDRGLAAAHQSDDDDVPFHGPHGTGSPGQRVPVQPPDRSLARCRASAVAGQQPACPGRPGGARSPRRSPGRIDGELADRRADQAARMDDAAPAVSDAIPSTPSDGTTEARHLQPSAGCDDRCDAGQRASDRDPAGPAASEPHGKDDRHEVGDASQRRTRERLDAGGQEERVAETAAVGASGGLGHRGRGGIETDDQGVGRGRGASQHGPAVAGAEVDDHPLGAGDPVGDLADVDVGGSAADDVSHGPQSTLGR